MKQFLLMTIQAGAIIGLTAGMHLENPNDPLLGFFFVSFVIVAFMTGVLTHLSAWFRSRRALRHVQQSEADHLSRSALGPRLREIDEKLHSIRIGQKRR